MMPRRRSAGHGPRHDLYELWAAPGSDQDRARDLRRVRRDRAGAMISSIPWRFLEESAQFVATLPDPRRDLTIAWDQGDRQLYLSVIAPPAANVEGAQARVYAAPLSLLAAQLILPVEHHAALAATVAQERAVLGDEVLGGLGKVVEKITEPWPGAAEARAELVPLADLAQTVERLALDAAAADAFRERGA